MRDGPATGLPSGLVADARITLTSTEQAPPRTMNVPFSSRSMRSTTPSRCGIDVSLVTAAKSAQLVNCGGSSARAGRLPPATSAKAQIKRTNLIDASDRRLSHHHHHRILDQPLEGADQLGAERAVDRAVVAGQRHAHDMRRHDLAVAHDRAFL